jgi:hypothetical protein
MERQLIELTESILNGTSSPEAAESLLKLQGHLLGTTVFPVRNTAIFAVLSTLLLNSLPAILGWFKGGR